MSGLFVRAPETIEHYEPKFSETEACLHYRLHRYQARHGLMMFEDSPDPVTINEAHFVTICGVEFQGTRSTYAGDKFDIAATIANECQGLSPEAKQWLKENAVALTSDKRYWKAVNHRREIEKIEREITALQEKVRRGWIVQSLYALEVNENRFIQSPEREMVLAEFNGGAWPESY